MSQIEKAAVSDKAPILLKLFGPLLFFVFYWLVPALARASAGGKPATKVYNVADTRAMTPGISKWIADAYNGDSWLYGLLVVLVMAGLGAILGFTMDRLVRLTGIDLGKLEHRE